MVKIFRLLSVLALALFASVGSVGAAQAQEKVATQEDVKALTIKAAELVASSGVEGAEKVFNVDGEFKFGEVYVNVIDLNGDWVIYPPKPANKGRSILGFIDEDGKKLGEDLLATGKAGEGWVEYRWKNPATNSVQPKITYVKRVPGKDYIVYIGIYKK